MKEFKGLRFEEFISQEDISFAVRQLASKIDDDFIDKNPLFIIVLNGAFVFAADLLREISFDCHSTFVKLKSYDGMKSTGKLEQLLGLEISIADRHVIVVEDIVDTGNTLNSFCEVLRLNHAKSVSLVSLLFKKEAFQHNYKVDYVGFEIPNKFVIGYGLDYDDHGRNLKSIYQVID